jgi:hypothetical protein
LFDKTTPTLEAAASSGGEQIDDFLDRASVLGVGSMVESAVGEGSAQSFVKEEEQESNLHAFGREAVRVA